MSASFSGCCVNAVWLGNAFILTSQNVEGLNILGYKVYEID
jgi:hypothetical protein